MDGSQSGLIIRVPEAEPLVADLRLRLDRAAAVGVPAHVTALFPFVSPTGLDAEVLDRVGRVASQTHPFDYRFSRTDWFGGDVIFLGPDDPAPFAQLTRLLWDAFPEHPPYEGEFDEIVPHLTVGDRAPVEDLKAANRALEDFEPISGRATELTLMVQATDGQWNVVTSWSLGAS